mgnify:CR=1 FL=1
MKSCRISYASLSNETHLPHGELNVRIDQDQLLEIIDIHVTRARGSSRAAHRFTFSSPRPFFFPLRLRPGCSGCTVAPRDTRAHVTRGNTPLSFRLLSSSFPTLSLSYHPRSRVFAGYTEAGK